ncbi:hypothetical protein UPYG_G00065960 [Umbra pygmaea]|uniref:Uncharacterized protein n=1 Tax=Umbra pygmaea TaxID=75934 RepID=A0ABD0XE37_UMBPY
MRPLLQTSTNGPGSSHGSSSSSRGPQTSCSRATLNSSEWGIPRRSQAKLEIKSRHLILGLYRCLLPAGRAWNTSLGRHPGGILIRCPTTSTGSF